MFHFLNLVDECDQKQIPVSKPVSIEKSTATSDEAQLLSLKDSEAVIRIRRVRFLSQKPVIEETVTIPYSFTPGLENQFDDIPNTLYRYYEKAHGFSVTRATEWLSAVSADKDQADLLQVEVGDPLLSIKRLAYTYNDQPVELRISACLTEAYRYLSELT